MNEKDYRAEVLSSDQWCMRGVIRVTHLPTGAVVAYPFGPGFGQHKAMAGAMTHLQMIVEDFGK